MRCHDHNECLSESIMVIGWRRFLYFVAKIGKVLHGICDRYFAVLVNRITGCGDVCNCDPQSARVASDLV